MCTPFVCCCFFSKRIVTWRDSSHDVVINCSLFLSWSVFMAQPGAAPSPPRVLLGLNWWMWTAIGTGFTVVVFLMVLVICLCKRIKRKKVSNSKSSIFICHFRDLDELGWRRMGYWSKQQKCNVIFFSCSVEKIAQNENEQEATGAQAVLPVQMVNVLKN